MAKIASGTVYPLSALRTLVLLAQLLTAPNGMVSPALTPGGIVDLVKALGYVRIDTLHVVNQPRPLHHPFGRVFKSYAIGDLHQLIYTAQQRVYGYFCFPILHKDRLVSRFDPKLDRKSGLLHMNALYLEPGIASDDELIAGVAAALRDFLAWHGAKNLIIEKSNPPAFGEKLLSAL